MSAIIGPWQLPETRAARRALRATPDAALVVDLLFLEAWEREATPDIASTLRARQIRRANPRLAAAIRSELRMRPVGSIGLSGP